MRDFSKGTVLPVYMEEGPEGTEWGLDKSSLLVLKETFSRVCVGRGRREGGGGEDASP